MKNQFKKIALLTSGGDAPGMNAAIRSVVRTCVFHKIVPVGVSKGYDGLISGKMVEMNARSVKGIINKGGTILKTARSEDFRYKEGRKIAFEMLKNLCADKRKNRLYLFELFNIIIENGFVMRAKEPKGMTIREIDSLKDL